MPIKGAGSLDRGILRVQKPGQLTAAEGLDARAQRLVKLGVAIGALAEGAVRSSVRKARTVGLTDDEIRQTAVLAISMAGFPTAIAAGAWIEEVLAAQ